MTRVTSLFGLVLFLALCGVTYSAREAGAGMIYYVSVGGNDEHPGTMEEPWRTVQKAADTAVAGNTVYIQAGSYHERVEVRNSGTAQNGITFSGYPGESVTVDGTGIELHGREGVFVIAGREYVNVRGLRVTSSRATGIMVRESRFVTVEDCYTHDTADSGIGVWRSADVVVKGNEVVKACNGGSQECITIAGSERVQVVENHVHDRGEGPRGGEGIDAKDGCANVVIRGNHVHGTRLGIYVDAWKTHSHDIEVAQNIVHDCEGCGFAVASERGGLVENVRFANNIAYRNRSAGIMVAGWNGGWQHPIHNVQIINNTVYANGWEEHAWGGGIGVESSEARGIVIRNNICSQNREWQMMDQVGGGEVVIDHNLIDGYRGHEKETRGNASVEGSPLFADPDGADFRLRAGSPAVNAGSSEGAPTVDFAGNPRPQGVAPDIGAFEQTGTSAKDD